MYPHCNMKNDVSNEAREYNEEQNHYGEQIKIHVRFVTRGTNPQTIVESCHDIQRTLHDPELAKRVEWIVEVVTDKYMEISSHVSNIHQIVVKDDYVTPKDSKFKGRALNYAAEFVKCHTDAWILHLDEESYFDVENGHKIVDWCIQET